ncbi:MAG: cation-transporting P-type ATPase, partial [Halioglobus sp.]|nr:cation-transporting P-type ATPase [Halioglobus sp.]
MHEPTPGLSAAPYQLTAAEVLQQLDSHPEQGVAEAAAEARRARCGANLLDETGGQPLYTLLLQRA